jgi:hypothetical protein
MMRRPIAFLVVLILLGVACAPSGPSGPGSSVSNVPARPGRALVAAMEAEPKSLAGRLIAQVGQTLHLRRIFNADLALLDDQSNPLPYLAEALPQLNSDSWKVFPDGRMETTYRLKPDLAWHDGTPLTAHAFVFATQVFSTRDFGQASSPPFSLIASVETPDDRTVLIHWKEPYAAAGALQSLGASAATGLPPLPRHILGPALESGAETFVNHPYWSHEYVGLGPYRLDRWEPGAFLEGCPVRPPRPGPTSYPTDQNRVHGRRQCNPRQPALRRRPVGRWHASRADRNPYAALASGQGSDDPLFQLVDVALLPGPTRDADPSRVARSQGAPGAGACARPRQPERSGL